MSSSPEHDRLAQDLRRIPPPPGQSRLRYPDQTSGGPETEREESEGSEGNETTIEFMGAVEQVNSPAMVISEASHEGSAGGATDQTEFGEGTGLDDVEFPRADADLTGRLRSRLEEAVVAFEAERFQDAEKLLASIENLHPGVVEVIELQALTWYRMGRWRKATTEMTRVAQLTDSVDQHPVLIDCARALHQWVRVDELWDELASHGAEEPVLEEGRIARAGAYADRGMVREAIDILEAMPLSESPDVYHLRRWYALADLYERIGDITRARRLFKRLDSTAPGFGDVQQRLRSLG